MTALPVCPDWCEEPDQHGYTDTLTDQMHTPSRTHGSPNIGTVERPTELRFGNLIARDLEVSLICQEILTPDGPLREPTTVTIWNVDTDGELTPDQARELAALLVTAADIADSTDTAPEAQNRPQKP